jgi:DNA-binding IclR family transcriptional regulator
MSVYTVRIVAKRAVPQDQPQRPATGVNVLLKTAVLLDTLKGAGEQLTAAEIAELIGEPRSTVYRLLATLERLDWIEPGTRRGTFRLGLGLFRLGTAIAARFDEREAATTVLQRIHDETQETAFLCVRRGFDAVCIYLIEGLWVKSMALQLGTALPLHIGAAPRALLAFESEEFRVQYLKEAELRPFTARGLKAKRDYMASLQEIRELGYVVSDGDVVIGMAAIGAPVFDHEGRLRAAISFGGPRPSLLEDNSEANIARIVEGSHQVSLALGYDPDAPWPPR